jgi:hypothetical protein
MCIHLQTLFGLCDYLFINYVLCIDPYAWEDSFWILDSRELRLQKIMFPNSPTPKIMVLKAIFLESYASI